MASLVTKARNEFTFIWRVENYSHCWHKFGEELVSPVFVVDLMQKTAWTLCLYPRGYDDCHFISFFLQREELDVGPPVIEVNYELSFLAPDGSNLFKAGKNEFLKNGSGYGKSRFAPRSEVLIEKRDLYLPQDTLTVCCKLFTLGGNGGEAQSHARTRIQIETLSFAYTVEDFCNLIPCHTGTVEVESSSMGRSSVLVDVIATDGSCCEEKLMVEIKPAIKEIEVVSCKIYLLDASRNLVKCGRADNRFDLIKEDALNVPLLFSKKKLMEKSDEYLPQNSLTLRCECTFSVALEFEKIEKTVHGLHLIPESTPIRDGFTIEGSPNSHSISSDFMSFYNEQVLSDVTLKTKTRSFPAHKAVLAARSQTFRQLFTVEEKDVIDCVDMEDLEDDAVHRLLMFFYTDVVENLELDIAYELLKAADKYQVEQLKDKCSSFLMDNLNVSNASKLLLLADTSNDTNLKTVVEEFILEHEQEVFGSDAWDNIIAINSTLAMKTMHLKYKKKDR